MTGLATLLAAAAALALAAPAGAQHHGHHMPPPKAKPAPKPAAKKPAAKKPAAKKAPAKRPAAKKAPAKKQATPKPAADPHAGHVMPESRPRQAVADPHAGHAMPEAQQQQPSADPHAGHAMDEAEPATEVPPGPPPPEALTGPAHAADTLFGAETMEAARRAETTAHGAMPVGKFLVERAEARVRDGRDGYRLDAQAWFGGDIDKAWFKAELDGNWGRSPEHGELQALWSHAILPFFDLQAGLRYDGLPGADRSYAVLGLQGLAPYWFELDTALFLSTKGELTGRFEGEYDLRITQKLILQPRVELDYAFENIPEIGVGAGLREGSLGLRLRYEFTPQFAPYVGLEGSRAFGRTRDYRRREGEKPGSVDALVGLRVFF